MNNIDAIQILSSYGVPQDEEQFREALDLAIKALEQTEWISVKDRLLDEWEIKGKKAELWIINGKLQVRYLGTIHNVELPSPYEGE